jgi:hypothetical protein
MEMGVLIVFAVFRERCLLVGSFPNPNSRDLWDLLFFVARAARPLSSHTFNDGSNYSQFTRQDLYDQQV